MTTVSVADARANLSKIIESVDSTHERYEVTRNGDRVAVILGADDYDSLVETLEILADPETMAGIREGIADLDAGRSVSGDDVRAEMVRLGRLRE